MNSDREPSDAEYGQLLVFRTELRRFLHWSEEQAHAEELTPAKHQLLLAIRGHASGSPTVGEVAEVLLLRHHSAVGLVDRAVEAGLVERQRSERDHRVVRLRLTPLGERKLARLGARHLEELRRLRRFGF
jgi:DNA-binding MarR family transcriptional regulator